MTAYQEGRSLTRHDIETGGSAYVSLKTLASHADYCMIQRVTIPSNRADRPTLVQILNLRCTDQQYWSGRLVVRPVSNLSYSAHTGCATQIKQELSYRKQIMRQLCTQFVESITVTLKSMLRVTQGHWKRNHWTDHTRLTIRRVIGR